MANYIHRNVLFKVADAEKQSRLVEAVEKMAKENSKVFTFPLPQSK